MNLNWIRWVVLETCQILCSIFNDWHHLPTQQLKCIEYIFGQNQSIVPFELQILNQLLENVFYQFVIKINIYCQSVFIWSRHFLFHSTESFDYDFIEFHTLWKVIIHGTIFIFKKKKKMKSIIFYLFVNNFVELRVWTWWWEMIGKNRVPCFAADILSVSILNNKYKTSN